MTNKELPSQPTPSLSIWENPLTYITPLCHSGKLSGSIFPEEFKSLKEELDFYEAARSLEESLGFKRPPPTEKEIENITNWLRDEERKFQGELEHHIFDHPENP